MEQQKKQQDSADAAPAVTAAVKKIPEIQLKDYSWDQSEKFVKLYLTNLPGLSSLPNEQIITNFTQQSVAVKVENLSGKSFNFSINNTCHQINPDKSYHKAKSDYLLVFLAKHNPGSSWSHITAAEKAAADLKKKADEPKLDEKADPSAGLMNMIKKMYEDGDDDMKRTIAKAWTEGQDKKGKDGLGAMGMGAMGQDKKGKDGL